MFALVALLSLAACGRDVERPLGDPPGAPTYETEIHAPERLQGLETRSMRPEGGEIFVGCATCHEGRSAPMVSAASELDEFHGGMEFAHGGLRCASCHDPEQRSDLRMADGTRIPMTEAMTLCAQCHGPQFRDYEHGAHGGMAGYWDRSQGARTRNHCIDCHDPHAPAYPSFEPMPGPRDRFLNDAPGGH